MELINKFIWVSGTLAIVFFVIYFIIQTIKRPTFKRFFLLILVFLFFLAFQNSNLLFTFWLISIGLFSLTLLFLLTYSISAIFITDQKHLKGETNFSISVVVVIHNEEEVIEHTVEKLLELNYNKKLMEIIVIDDNSNDNSLNILSKFSDRIKIVRMAGNKGKPHAINEVAKHLESDLVCVFDADSLPEEDFLLKAVPYFINDAVAIVQGRNVEYNEENTVMAKLSSFDIDVTHFTVLKGKSKIGGMLVCEGRGFVMRKSVFIELEGFDTSLPAEDWDFGFRCQIAGYKVINDSRIINNEQSVETVKDFYYQRSRWLSALVLAFFKNITTILMSKKLTTFRKIDFLFPLIFTLWAITVNLLGLLSLSNYILNSDLFPVNYTLIFLCMYVCMISPALLQRKRLSDIIYLPLVLIFYWSFSIIITMFIEEYYFLEKTVKVKKATHKSPLLRNGAL